MTDAATTPATEPTVRIEGVTYIVRRATDAGNTAWGRHDLVSPEGTVAGTITRRWSARGTVAVRRGVAKGLSSWEAEKATR